MSRPDFEPGSGILHSTRPTLPAERWGDPGMMTLCQVVDHCSRDSLWELIKARQYCVAARGQPFSSERFSQWLSDVLVDHHGNALFAPPRHGHLRFVTSELQSIFTGTSTTSACRDIRLSAHIEEAFVSRGPHRPDVMTSQLRVARAALEHGITRHLMGRDHAWQDEQLQAFAARADMAPLRGIGGTWTELRVATRPDDTRPACANASSAFSRHAGIVNMALLGLTLLLTHSGQYRETAAPADHPQPARRRHAADDVRAMSASDREFGSPTGASLSTRLYDLARCAQEAFERWQPLPLAAASDALNDAPIDALTTNTWEEALQTHTPAPPASSTVAPSPEMAPPLVPAAAEYDCADTSDHDRIPDPIHIWEHACPSNRRQLLNATQQFATRSESAFPSAINYTRIKLLNDDGWYVYSQIPNIFLLCDRVLDATNKVIPDLFDALLGSIAQIRDTRHLSGKVCYDGLTNRSLLWEINHHPGSSTYFPPITLKSRPPEGQAQGQTRGSGQDFSPDNRRSVLMEILQIQMRANDPRLDFSDLLTELKLAKHEIEISDHIPRSASEARQTLRDTAMSLLIEANCRHYPSRFITPSSVRTPGALKFVNFLLETFDPVLSSAPDHLPYFGADMLRARFGDYFALKNQKEGANQASWDHMVQDGDRHIDDWSILTFDEQYMKIVLSENEAFVRRMQTLFANNIARTAWLYYEIKVGRLTPRVDIARRYLIEAGLDPEARVAFRTYITLEDAYHPSAAIRDQHNQTLLDIYLTVNDGLRKLRTAEPRYATLLNDTVLSELPNRADVIEEYEKIFDLTLAARKTTYRKAIQQAYRALPPAILEPMANAIAFKLHLWRPLQHETPFIQRQLQRVGIKLDTPLMRKVTGFQSAGLIEAIAPTNASRFFLFAPHLFSVKNLTHILVDMPEITTGSEAALYMQSFSTMFFTPRFAGEYEEYIYYKNDIVPHLTYACRHLDAIWNEWIEARLNYAAWRKKQGSALTAIETMQDSPSEFYLTFLPFSACWSLWNAGTITENDLADMAFCALDMSFLRHVPRPAKTWLKQSLGMGRLRTELDNYQRVAATLPHASPMLKRRITNLKKMQHDMNEYRLQRSISEAMEIPRALSPFPWAHATSNSLAQVAQAVGSNIYTIAAKTIPIRGPRTETLQAKRLRLLSSTHLDQKINSTLFGEIGMLTTYLDLADQMRLSADLSTQWRLTKHFCVPRACVAICEISDLNQLSRQKRSRVLLQLVKGMNAKQVASRALEDGYRFSHAAIGWLNRLDAMLPPIRKLYNDVRDNELMGLPNGEDILWIALKNRRKFNHPADVVAAIKHLRTSYNFIRLQAAWYVLRFVFEPRVNRLIYPVERLVIPDEDGVTPRPRRERAPARATLEPDVEHVLVTPDTPRADHVEDASSVRCERSVEAQEIRSCTLPLPVCMNQWADEQRAPAPKSSSDSPCFSRIC